MKREGLEARLTKLEAGHDDIAKSLQIKAQALGALPREMRDAIFAQLYRSENTISPEISRVGPKTFFEMPKDPALYMSQRHVREVIAGEAGEVFYAQNTFLFGFGYSIYCNPNDVWDSNDLKASLRWSLSKYDLFFDTDHYQSGLRPRDFIRKVSVWLGNLGRTTDASSKRFQYDARGENPRQITFEREHSQWQDRARSIGAPFYDDRAHLEYFLNLHGLTEFTIVISAADGDLDSMCRLINPAVRQMRNRGVKVKIVNRTTSWVGDYYLTFLEDDISCFFDAPSTGDYAMFKEKHSAPIFVHDINVDPLEAWWTWTKTNDWDIVESIYESFSPVADQVSHLPHQPQAGLIRVWLYEAYEVFKFYEQHHVIVDKLNGMWEELRSFDREEVVLRRRYYGRMMELMTGQR